MNIVRSLLAAFAVAWAAWPSCILAEDFPARTVRIIVPQSPGGATDTFGRAIGQKLSERWKHPVVIENRAGGNFQIGATAVTTAPPDGYSVLLGSIGSHALVPHLYAKPSFDAFKDVYLKAYESGCKGCTTWRPNDITGAILSLDETRPEAIQALINQARTDADRIWDERRHEAVCANDHAGLRGLHYHWDGARLLVASDPAGVLAPADFEARPNPQFITQTIANEILTRDETPWVGVMRLQPAKAMTVDPRGPRLARGGARARGRRGDARRAALRSLPGCSC